MRAIPTAPKPITNENITTIIENTTTTKLKAIGNAIGDANTARITIQIVDTKYIH